MFGWRPIGPEIVLLLTFVRDSSEFGEGLEEAFRQLLSEFSYLLVCDAQLVLEDLESRFAVALHDQRQHHDHQQLVELLFVP